MIIFAKYVSKVITIYRFNDGKLKVERSYRNLTRLKFLGHDLVILDKKRKNIPGHY